MVILLGMKIFGQQYVFADEQVSSSPSGTWSPLPVSGVELNNISSPTTAAIRFEMIDKYGIFYGKNYLDFFRDGVKLYKIYGNNMQSLSDTVIFTGVVEQFVATLENKYQVSIGPPASFWGARLPKLFMQQCRYTNTNECPYANTCLKTWPACQANSRTAYFGGFRRLLLDNDKIIFREGS